MLLPSGYVGIPPSPSIFTVLVNTFAAFVTIVPSPRIGHYGRFDGCCSSVIRELQKTYKDIKLELVIPYITKGINEYRELYYKDYDNILMADIPLNTPQKFQIIKGNEYVVDNCEYVICYVERHYGGAYRTFTYARRKKKEIFNISPRPVED